MQRNILVHTSDSSHSTLICYTCWTIDHVCVVLYVYSTKIGVSVHLIRLVLAFFQRNHWHPSFYLLLSILTMPKMVCLALIIVPNIFPTLPKSQLLAWWLDRVRYFIKWWVEGSDKPSELSRNSGKMDI